VGIFFTADSVLGLLQAQWRALFYRKFGFCTFAGIMRGSFLPQKSLWDFCGHNEGIFYRKIGISLLRAQWILFLTFYVNKLLDVSRQKQKTPSNKDRVQ
jgi:hypothetical protein